MFNSPICEICGGSGAPIVSGKHADPKFCAERKAAGLLFPLLEAHAEMEKDPVFFSKDNPTRQHYYQLFNKTLDLLVAAYLAEMGQDENEATQTCSPVN